MYDVAALVLMLLAAFAMSPDGAALLRVLEGRLLEGVIRGALFAALPCAVIYVPARITYRRLRSWPTKLGRFIVAATFGAASFVCVDQMLKQAPPEPDLSALLRHDTAPMAIQRSGNGVIGLKTMVDGATLDQGRDDVWGCFETCRLLLHGAIASEVVILSGGLNPVLDRYTLAAQNGACGIGSTGVDYRRPLMSNAPSMTVCRSTQPDQTRPIVVFEVDTRTRSNTADWIEGVTSLSAITVRHGAMSQTVHVVRVRDAQGGGLLWPDLDPFDQQVRYSPNIISRDVAVFDLTQTGPLPRNSTEPAVPSALYAVIAQALSLRPDRLGG